MDEDELLPLSAVAQYGYCPRRAALLLLDQCWQDNVHTAEGTLQHERVHQAAQESRRHDVEIFSMPVRSLFLGLSGSVDCVELSTDPLGIAVKGQDGLWSIRPVEYKHGEVRNEIEYELQLCAEAMAIEEMLGCSIDEGDLFYYNDHRRVAVPFTKTLRKLVRETAVELHKIMADRNMPQASKTKRCRECSMKDVCQPGVKKISQSYMEELVKRATGGLDDT
jgi:CRISPR-associated exonuclease Cas4